MWKKFSALSFVLLFLYSVTSAADSYDITGSVVGVSDGDTLTILKVEGEKKTPVKIRMLGIDAPEKNQAFGADSKKSLSEMVFNQTVTAKVLKTDRYGRSLAKIIKDQTDINLEQIKKGMAWHYKAYRKDQSAEDRILYAQEETKAKNSRIGLWAEENPKPQAPWEFRRAEKKLREESKRKKQTLK